MDIRIVNIGKKTALTGLKKIAVRISMLTAGPKKDHPMTRAPVQTNPLSRSAPDN
jgi:hypothetical protein